MLLKFKNFTYYWLPLIAYCVFIFVQSSYPSPAGLPTFEFSDKLMHFFAFILMGVLFYRAYSTLTVLSNANLILWLSMISASLYGISDEIHQSFVSHRHGSTLDVSADILGAICGAYLYHRWGWRKADVRSRVTESRKLRTED